MCSRCSVKQKKIWVFGCGSFLLFAALIIGLMWASIVEPFLYKQLVLEDGSPGYERWKETPIPIYLEVFLFNWTNPDQLSAYQSVKPKFTEHGPYVFLEKHKRVNVLWNNTEHTVNFNQTRTWFFDSEKSNGSLNDQITNLNSISNTVAYVSRFWSGLLKPGANTIINEYGSLTVTKSVQELLFDGYNDPILDFLPELIESGLITVEIPYTKFGWFVNRNESSSYDGQFTMFTGVGEIEKLGIVEKWNGANKTNYFKDNCNKVKGTTGELWPPIPSKQDISIFSPDACRYITLRYDSDIDHLGLAGRQWVGDDLVFDNGHNYGNATSCFCTADADSCPDLPYGVQNVSICKFGAPAFMSYPHFYLADPIYVNAIEGLQPTKEKHEFIISLEPSTGAPLNVRAGIQVNLLLQPDKDLDTYADVPKMMIPMFWFRQVTTLPEDLVKEAKNGLLMLKLGAYIAYGIAAVGLLLIIIGIIITVNKKWSSNT